MRWEPAVSAPSLLLVDVPEHRRRRAVEHAGERFAPGAGLGVFAERDVDHLLVSFLLDVGGDLLLLVRGARSRELILQLLDLGIVGPAEPAAGLALAADREIDDRIDDVG